MKKSIAVLLALVLSSPIAVMAVEQNGYYNGYENGNGYETGYDYESDYGYDNDNDYQYENGNGYDYVPEYTVAQEAPAAFPTAIEGYIEDGEAGIIYADGEQFTITPGIPVIDAETGMPVSLAEVENNRVIIYYYLEVKVVIANVTEGAIPPQFGIVEAIERTEDQVTVTIRGGSILVTIPADSPIEPYLTRNIATVYDIHVGSYLLMWYPMVTASYPGLATAQRTLILNRIAADYTEHTVQPNDYVEIVDEFFYDVPAPPIYGLNEALARVYVDFITVNNATMVPLRPVAESLGFTVIWNEADRSVSLNHADGQVFATVTLGQANFEGHVLDAAPVIHNDRTFVPVALFGILLGL